MRAKVLIVGLGSIGMGYDLTLDPDDYVYSHARAFSLHASFELVAGVDVDRERRAQFEKIYNCPSFDNVIQALRVYQVDVVVIAVSTEFHGEVLQSVLTSSKPQVILCEKPISNNLEEASVMLRSCEKHNINMYVNYIRRSEPGALEIRKRLFDEKIKSPIKGVAWYSKGLIHNGSHIVNLLEHWMGPVVGVNIIDKGRLWNGCDPEPDVMLYFECGSVVLRSAWEEAFSHYGIELLVYSGRLQYEKGGEVIRWQAVTSDKKLTDYKVLSDNIELIESCMDKYQWHVTDQLARAICGLESHICTGSEALVTLKSIQSIVEKI